MVMVLSSWSTLTVASRNCMVPCTAPPCTSRVLQRCTVARSIAPKNKQWECTCSRASRSTVCSVKALALDNNYGFVMASVSMSAAIVQWMAIQVGQARRKCGVAYPAMYATGDDENAKVFNCTQRGHQNTLEGLPPTLALVCLLGLKHPITAAALGMTWNVGRLLYFTGYATGDPSKRIPGFALSFFTGVALILVTLWAGVNLAIGA